MNNNQQTTLFGGLTVLGIGVAVGAALGLLYAPAEGRKTRLFLAKKMEEWVRAVEESEEYAAVKRVFGEVSKQTVDLYTRIQDEVIRNVEEMRITAGSIDKQAYYAAVEKAIMTFSTELGAANARTLALRAQLKAEADRLPDRAPQKLTVPVEKKPTVKKSAKKTTAKPAVKQEA